MIPKGMLWMEKSESGLVSMKDIVFGWREKEWGGVCGVGGVLCGGEKEKEKKKKEENGGRDVYKRWSLVLQGAYCRVLQ